MGLSLHIICLAVIMVWALPAQATTPEENRESNRKTMMGMGFIDELAILASENCPSLELSEEGKFAADEARSSKSDKEYEQLFRSGVDIAINMFLTTDRANFCDLSFTFLGGAQDPGVHILKRR